MILMSGMAFSFILSRGHPWPVECAGRDCELLYGGRDRHTRRCLTVVQPSSANSIQAGTTVQATFYWLTARCSQRIGHHQHLVQFTPRMGQLGDSVVQVAHWSARPRI